LRRKFWDHFRELKDQGRTIFITTQYVSEADNCDLVGVQNNGKLLLVDTPQGIRHHAYGTARVNPSFPLFNPSFAQFLMGLTRNKCYRKFRSIIPPQLIGRIFAMRFSKWPSSVKDMHISTVKLPRTVCWWRARKSRALSSKWLF
jgi:hypothetical protein